MFNNIGIIGGSGVMAKMFTQKLKDLGKTVITSDETTISKEKELVTSSELIILSVPIDHTKEVIRRIKRWLHKDQLLTDFTSVKNNVIPEMLETEASVISSHPMFGPMTDFSGQNVVLLPVRENKFLHKFERFFKELNLNTEIVQDWHKHDEYMSFIQGLIHFTHIVFAQTLHSKDVDLNTLLKICSPVYQSHFAFACRIFARDPHLYTHILMDNPQNKEVLNEFVKNAQNNIKNLQKGEEEVFKKHFQESKEFLGEYVDEFAKQSDFLVENLKEYNQRKK
ncbi:MAG: chorismate mutase/prephenate dehydrogenase [bacterium]|jgi:chorismate mutase/prephenate dehydrogenase